MSEKRTYEPYPKAAQIPAKRQRRTDASPRRIQEIRAKKCSDGCRLCPEPNAQAHHLIPRSLGGVWTENNIMPLCFSCHEGVERRDLETCAGVRHHLSDSEYAYVVTKAGETFLDRYYPVRWERTA